MISPFSATKLAYTKLKTRRLRLAISLIVVSLLFSILIAATIIQAGFFTSFSKFSSEGLSGRYIIAGNGGPIVWGELNKLTQNLTLIERAESLQDQLIEQKIDKAMELGLDYNPEWDNAVLVHPDGSKFLNFRTSISQQVIAEHRESLRPLNTESFKDQLKPLRPTATYRAIQAQQSDSALLYIKNGREPTAEELTNYELQQLGFNSITQGAWQLIDDELISSFLIDNQTLVTDDGSIPVIAPSHAIEYELGLDPLSVDATPEQKRTRIEQLRAQAAGKMFEVCYRNKPSLELFNKATAQQSDKATNGAKENYAKPSLLYGLPEAPCESPTVESDTRDKVEKDQEAKWQEFNKTFNQPKPESYLLKFKVVGIKKDSNPSMSGQSDSNFTPEQIFDTAFSANAGHGWLSPLSAKDQNQTLSTIFEQNSGDLLGSMVTYFAEFSSGEEAKQALLERTCTPNYGEEEKGLLGTKLEIGKSPNCSREDRQLILHSFGSNSIAIDQFKDYTQQILFISAVAIAVLAAIVLMSMVGRIIADSRRETAIFRAVGATRLSIIQIYFTYTGFLVLWIMGLSLLLGNVAALVFNNHFSPDFSIAAVVAFSARDLSQKFTFIGFNWTNLGLIVLVIIAASYLASVIPILRSVRRNPMSDMREE